MDLVNNDSADLPLCLIYASEIICKTVLVPKLLGFLSHPYMCNMASCSLKKGECGNLPG